MRDGWVDTNLLDVVEVLDRFRKPINATERESRQGSVPYYGANGQTGWIDDFLFDEELVLLGEDAIDFADPSARKAYLIDGPSWVNNHAHVLRAKTDKVESYFLAESLNKVDFSQYVSFGTRSKLTQASMNGITIPLPSLPEQKRIVDLISSVDSYIEVLQQQLESAKRSRNAVMHELLTAGGDDWEYKILSDICEVRDGTHDSPKPSDEGFALVTSKNIKDGKLDLESAYLISPQDYVEVNKRSKVEKFNLLISMIGTIGEVIVVEEEPNFAIKNVGLLKSTEPILSRYLCHYLESQLGKNAIYLSVSGSTQKFISLGKLRVLPVLFPPRQNQKAIVEVMSLFDRQISKNLEAAARIKSLRSSLLSDLLGGEHEIPASYDKAMGAT